MGKTIDTKLNEHCPYFNRWDSLYGGRQNVCPTDLVEGGLDSDSEEEETQSITNVFPTFQLSNGEDNGMTDDFPSQTVSLSLIDENLQDDCNVERIIPSSTNSSGPKITRPPTNKKINSTNVLSVNPVLTELAVVVASETASGGKLTEKRKGDFTSTYASAKAKEAEILSINKNRELDIADKRLQLDSERLSLEKHMRQKSGCYSTHEVYDSTLGEATITTIRSQGVSVAIAPESPEDDEALNPGWSLLPVRIFLENGMLLQTSNDSHEGILAHSGFLSKVTLRVPPKKMIRHAALLEV